MTDYTENSNVAVVEKYIKYLQSILTLKLKFIIVYFADTKL